ncbi:MAG: type VI secretion system tip protein VgrG [Gemmatimonas sp.]|nr:type VI secretion system tip protein VgrG [Gemmatimonas sp.]
MSATYIQTNRPLRLTTPLGKDVLLLERIVGIESVSALFRFQLDLLSEQPNLDASKLLGQAISIDIDFGEDGAHTRHIGGIVSHFIQLERGRRFTRYKAEIVPQLWLTTLAQDSRIFQEKKIDEIAAEVLSGLDFKIELTGQYEPSNYRVQYRETDFTFLSRVLENEGIYYFHSHSSGGHQLLLSDASQQAPSCDGPSSQVKAVPADAIPLAMENPVVFSLTREEGVISSKWKLWDHTFELPGKNLEASEPVVSPLQSVMPSAEVYDYPGNYAQRFDGIDRGGGERAGDLQKIFDENRRVVGLRARAGASRQTTLRGESNYPFLTPGHLITIEGHYRSEFNGEYFIVSVTHQASVETYDDGGRSPFSYRNSFVCVPKDRPFAPPRVAPLARVTGAQTAVVVGPSGSEIFTDKYGRVKVQFHWDRQGQQDSDSSCWVRVATPWAGKNWGMITIPRIGSEVVVDFLEGDPDRPIIVGMVYNAESMPPYTLPDNATQSGLKTRSSLDGSPDTFNEIRFEDKKGAEELYVHAEKNLNSVVENDETRKVGFAKQDAGDQTVEVFNNQTVKVGAGEGEASDGSQSVTIYKDQTLVLETGNQTVTLKEGDRSITLDKGNESILLTMGSREVSLDQGDDKLTIKSGNLTTKLDMGNATLELGMGNAETKAGAGAIKQEAMQGIEMKVGQSSIKIDQAGITIKGMMVKVEGTVQTEVKGLMTQVNGDAILTVKGGVTMIN